MPDKLLTRAQAAAYLGGVTPAILYQWRKRGYGPKVFRVNDAEEGRANYYRKSDLDDFLATETIVPLKTEGAHDRCVDWPGLSHARWAKIWHIIKSRKYRAYYEGEQKTYDLFANIFDIVAKGKWPDDSSSALQRSVAGNIKNGLMAEVFEKLTKEDDFPFALVTVHFLCPVDLSRRQGAGLLPVFTQVIGRIVPQNLQNVIKRRLNVHLRQFDFVEVQEDQLKEHLKAATGAAHASDENIV
jgi:hypothetical protein